MKMIKCFGITRLYSTRGQKQTTSYQSHRNTPCGTRRQHVSQKGAAPNGPPTKQTTSQSRDCLGTEPATPLRFPLLPSATLSTSHETAASCGRCCVLWPLSPRRCAGGRRSQREGSRSPGRPQTPGPACIQEPKRMMLQMRTSENDVPASRHRE